MQFATRKAAASAMTTVALLTVAACDRSMEPTAVGFKPTVNFATAVADADVPRITLSLDADGTYHLDRVCDVFIGVPAVDPADGAPQRYAHKLIVELPADAGPNPVIKVVGDAAMQASGSKVFTCDADDPDIEGLQPVIDPITDHAAKGDGPTVTTDGVTLDLNGYSITVSPAFGTAYQIQNADGTITAGTFENLGVVLAGSNQTLTNSADVGAEVDPATGRNVGVSYIWGFGHNVDVEAESPTVRGRIVNGVYNLESNGGFGIRLSSGTMTIDAVKSVNNEDLDAGGGFEARRISSGFLTVSNSHFEGGAEGAFLREVSGVTFTKNYVASVAGPAISTRQARSLSGRPIVITDNVVGAGTTGILWGRESTSSGNLKIEGNILLNTGCSIGLSSRNALSSISPYSLSSTATNFIGNVNFRNVEKTVKATTCRVGD
jgi:hypothetical protein